MIRNMSIQYCSFRSHLTMRSLRRYRVILLWLLLPILVLKVVTKSIETAKRFVKGKIGIVEIRKDLYCSALW